MIVALCSGQGRTFEGVTRMLGQHLTDVVCDVPDAPVLEKANSLGVRSHLVPRSTGQTRASHEEALMTALKECAPFTIVALLGFMRILSAEFLNQLHKNWPCVEIINLHPAPLSQYKGAHGLRFAIESRAPRWGVSVHRVTPQLDAGPLLSFRELPVFPTDTFETLRERAHPLEVSAVLEAIDILTRRSPSS